MYSFRGGGGSYDDKGTQHGSRSTYKASIANRNNLACVGWSQARERLTYYCPNERGVKIAEMIAEVQEDQGLEI